MVAAAVMRQHPHNESATAFFNVFTRYNNICKYAIQLEQARLQACFGSSPLAMAKLQLTSLKESLAQVNLCARLPMHKIKRTRFSFA